MSAKSLLNSVSSAFSAVAFGNAKGERPVRKGVRKSWQIEILFAE